MIKKNNIILIGPMGSGKSTIGKQLSKHLNMTFFDSDLEIEKKTGVDINWIFDIEGEKGFRKREKKVIQEIIKKQKIILSTGGGSIESKEIREKIKKFGFVIYLKTNIKQQIIRTQYDKKRPILQKKELIKKKLKNLSYKRNPIYEKIADLTICTDNYTSKTITNKIIQIIKLK